MAKRTPLYERHIALGAKMTEFVGWEMPERYSGIIKEHGAVRQRAGLFDIFHMGQIEVRGEHATAVVHRVSTNDVGKLPFGKAQYSVMCREDGGIVDDILTYRLAPDRLLIVVNAGNRQKDYDWIRQVAEGEALGELRSIGLPAWALQIGLPLGAGLLAIFAARSLLADLRRRPNPSRTRQPGGPA